MRSALVAALRVVSGRSAHGAHRPFSSKGAIDHRHHLQVFLARDAVMTNAGQGALLIGSLLDHAFEPTRCVLEFQPNLADSHGIRRFFANALDRFGRNIHVSISAPMWE